MVRGSELMVTPTLRHRRTDFYQDPERPGQARHYRCLMKAGINPVRLGYPTSEGPCWVCEAIAKEYRLFQELLARVQNLREIAGHLHNLCLVAFKLTMAVRCSTGMGRIPRAIIESEHPNELSFFRRALETARNRARVPSRSDTVWYRAESPPESGTFRSPGHYLNSDPTSRECVSISEIEHRAGIYAGISRIFLTDAEWHAAKGEKTYGKDPEELLLKLASQLKASPLALAEVVVVFPRPFSRLTDAETRRAESLAQRLRTGACRTLREKGAQPMTDDVRTALAAKRDLPKSKPQEGDSSTEITG